MNLITKVLFAGFTYLLMGLSNAQPEAEGQQQVTLDREMIDAIAARASPVCRSELEAALEHQADISTDCKEEIHSILLTLSDKFAKASDGADDGEAAAPPPTGNAGIWITLFVVAMVGLVSAYVYYVNSALAESGSDKKKKPLSKKKVHISAPEKIHFVFKSYYYRWKN